jgi:DNA-binding beta-propeller fold protein YncE
MIAGARTLSRFSLALCSLSFRNSRVVALDLQADVTTFAGDLSFQSGSTDGVGTNSQFNFPLGVSMSADGSQALVVDSNNNLIRHIVLSTGSVTTLAGDLSRASVTTDGVGTNSQFNWPFGVSLSADGSFALVTDAYNNLIRHIVITTASVTTIAGDLSLSSGATDGVGTNSQFSNPRGVSLSADGSFALVTDTYNNLIRLIVMSTASVTTLAGDLALSSGSTNGVGTNSLFSGPRAVSLSPDGSFALVADTDNNLIRLIVLSSASVTTLAGDLALSSGSTNGLGTNSLFSGPRGVSLSADGSFALVADTDNNLIRLIVLSTASVTTLAGDLALSSGSTNGVGTNSQFNVPLSVYLSVDGSFALVTEAASNLIRKMVLFEPTSSPTGVPSSAPSYVDEPWGQVVWDVKRSRSSGLCENQCSGHGLCAMNANCRCYTNENGDPAWTGADCSLRTCPMDTAWVGSVIGSNNLHPMVECSNKGLCNRQTGECECFTGYDGIACGRTTCPSECHHRGICWPERLLAVHASRLYATPWDALKQIGCVCDSGYRGPSCEFQECPSGPDPLAGYGNEAGRDCSGRGLCDYDKGLCSCFEGFFGTRCQHQQTVV